MGKPLISTRTQKELELIQKSGWITACALKKVLENVKTGITLADLDRVAEEEILRLGGQSSFKTVPGYHWTTCLTVNEEVVHGTPRDIILKPGDVLSVDLGAVYQGWHTDAAWTVLVGGKEEIKEGWEEKKRFLQVGERTLWEALGKAVENNRIGDISSTIQKDIEGAGYSVVRSLAGHGVGRAPHEEPEVPGFGIAGVGPRIRKNMTLAIEVIYTAGSGEMVEAEDGWTLSSLDHSWGGLFEMSVITRRGKAEVLTDWRKV